MQSKKTHEQQLRIIQKDVNTANADGDFDIEADLKRSDAAKRAFELGQDLSPGVDGINENRDMVRGLNQESQHHKGSGQA